MKIYTRTGDDGTTGLIGGTRVPKSDDRVSAYGAVDELNSILGLCLTECADTQLKALLAAMQPELFVLGSHLAAQDERAALQLPRPDADAPARMEAQIDQWEGEVAPLAHFIMPGGCKLAAWLHLARTVCRRAEREVVALRASRPKDAPRFAAPVKYLNRLSDWLFTAARVANARAKVNETPWIPQKPQ
ncbi:MAG: cob(I)yrinic acid a,c-diamide adenosyltransferase [Planctomycetaceae bacterium]|nr:Cob(I)yrinic acid a,c-diamide adenosyltransferase [Planctomycetota bacterium]MCQ3949218.1 cob(I)yrinic acid a,c-diamide adenosyltransferase [Planctomycetota bacterium]NUO15062.1 cob(I)yrinic acid a,c-diamide adenosyltransferase [Planctomycetaceae bacterium]GIK52708.1 MAG: ATP--cob(I)alamin adenosyltransferase [Planctomycetota bacterium]